MKVIILEVNKYYSRGGKVEWFCKQVFEVLLINLAISLLNKKYILNLSIINK